MGHTCLAWLESEDRSGAETALAGIKDYMAIHDGDNMRLVSPYDKINLAYVISNNATYFPLKMKLDQASLKVPHRFEKGIGLNLTSPELIYDFRDSPLPLTPGENTTAEGYETDEAGVAHYLALVLILADGRIPKGVRPQITHILNATATATTAATWTDLALTLTDTLPKGEYEWLGGRVQHSSPIAARINFKGMVERPALIPVAAANQPNPPFNDYWGKGYKFSYPDNLPTLEILEAAGSGTVTVEGYLRKIS